MFDRLNHLLRFHYRAAIVVLDDLERRRVHERVHKAVMNSENKILKLLILFNQRNLQAHRGALVDMNVPVMRTVSREIAEFSNDSL